MSLFYQLKFNLNNVQEMCEKMYKCYYLSLLEIGIKWKMKQLDFLLEYIFDM